MLLRPQGRVGCFGAKPCRGVPVLVGSAGHHCVHGPGSRNGVARSHSGSDIVDGYVGS